LEIHINISKSNKILAIKILIGCLFLFSGIVKLFPIIAFEVQLISHGILNWHIVTILARVTIAFEIFLGLCFLQNNYVKKIFIPAAIALLTIFTFDLVRAVIYLGFSGDCGCFGQVITMTPLEAIIKNIVLIAVLVYLYRLMEPETKDKWLLPAIFIIISFVPVFLLFPAKHYQVQTAEEQKRAAEQRTLEIINQRKMNQQQSEMPVKKMDTAVVHAIKVNEKLPVAAFKNFSGGVTVDFKKGTEIVAVLNTGCGDCIEAATGIGKLNKEMNLPPVYFLLLGDEKELPEFISKTKTNYPFKLLDEEEFFTLIKGSPPRVWLLQNGKIVNDWNFRNFSIDNLKTAVKKIKF
jgi:hypothetical protein